MAIFQEENVIAGKNESGKIFLKQVIINKDEIFLHPFGFSDWYCIV
jgi:hypothetical protein